MTLPKVVGREESLGRYLTQSNHFSRKHNSVRPLAFYPPPADLQLSVFRIDGLNKNQLWEIGQSCIRNRPQKTLYGVADIKVFKVQTRGLHVAPDNIPVRHANIVGWPEEIARRNSIAQELAADAIPKFRE